MRKLPPDTPEQALITNFNGTQLVVIAFAGTGKTTTLIKYALKNQKRRMLYIAYNRTVRDEATATFPKNVDCKTSHQIAFEAVGKDYRHKQKDNLSLQDISKGLGVSNWENVRIITQTLNRFFSSVDEEIQLGHLPEENEKGHLSQEELDTKKSLLEQAKLVWEKMKDVKDPFPMTHDGYLKLYQLSKPDLSYYYSAILLDEAQDANPVISSFVLAQRCIVIFVGDRHQQIYRFRGAENALDVAEMRAATRLYLTSSFRFGPQVSMVANAIMALKGESRSLIGRGKPDQVLMTLPDDAYPRAVLSRTVMGCINSGLDYANKGYKIYWAGGADSYQVNQLLNLYYLSIGQTENIKDKKLLSNYPNFDLYVKVAKQTKNFEMQRAIRVLKHYGEDLLELLTVLNEQTVEKEENADVIISTAHKSKGLEWDYVELSDDYPDVLQLKKRPDQKETYEDELNLIYVAVTRAMKAIAINAVVESILRYYYEQIEEMQ